MSTDNPLSRERLLTMQIIAGALPAGLTAFIGVILIIASGGNQPAPAANGALPIMSIVAGCFFAITGSLSFILPSTMTQAGVKQIAANAGGSDLTRLVGLKQTILIVGLALLEGAGFMGSLAFMIERQLLVLAIPLVALFLMLARFPTEGSVRAWLETQGRRVLELRQDRPSIG